MAIAFSNTGKATATSGTIPVTVTVNAGDTVVVCVFVNSSVNRTVSVADTGPGGNTYAQKSNLANGTSCQSFILGSLNVANAATTVTVTVSGTYTNCEVIVVTYTGVGANGFGNTGTNSGV